MCVILQFNFGLSLCVSNLCQVALMLHCPCDAKDGYEPQMKIA